MHICHYRHYNLNIDTRKYFIRYSYDFNYTQSHFSRGTEKFWIGNDLELYIHTVKNRRIWNILFLMDLSFVHKTLSLQIFRKKNGVIAYYTRELYHHHYHHYRAASTDFPNSLAPPVSIVYHTRQVFQASSSNSTKLLYIDSSWLSNLYSSIGGGPPEFIPDDQN